MSVSVQSTRIAVIGAGAWGTALALHLARAGHRVALYGRNADAMQLMQTARVNQRYLPDQPFVDTLKATSDFSQALSGAEAVLIATPCSAFSSTLGQLQQANWPSDQPIIWACKGFSEHSELLSQVLEQTLGESQRAVLISGPTFAKELAEGCPTAITVSGRHSLDIQRVVSWLHHGSLRAYANDDLIGVQVGGALKNIYAIAAGISDGLRFGANARAALLTRSLAELARLAEAMGAKPATLQGLAGLGDLLLTCTDDLSRNRRMGLCLAKGLSVEAAQAEIGQAVEGVRTAQLLGALATQYAVDMPIAEQVLRVLEGNITPEQAVQQLLQRSPVAE